MSIDMEPYAWYVSSFIRKIPFRLKKPIRLEKSVMPAFLDVLALNLFVQEFTTPNRAERRAKLSVDGT